MFGCSDADISRAPLDVCTPENCTYVYTHMEWELEWVHGYPPAFRPFGALKPIENQFHLTKSQTNVCVASPNLQILFCIVSGPWLKDEGGGERGLRLAENF